mmetsp:Transcript_49768/g.128034  ORF Transcript_49768/g.128034 Transcript_49768/m.128034 type:complete len:463 (-) Transcript_49768:381-1769(-)
MSKSPFFELQEMQTSGLENDSVAHSLSVPNESNFVRLFSHGAETKKSHQKLIDGGDSEEGGARPWTGVLRATSPTSLRVDSRGSLDSDEGDHTYFDPRGTARTLRFLDKKWERTEVTCLEICSDGDVSSRKYNRLDLLKEALDESTSSIERVRESLRSSGVAVPSTAASSVVVGDNEKHSKRGFRVRSTLPRGKRKSVTTRAADFDDSCLPICARDIRTLDPTIFSKAAFIVRKNAILITLESLRAIVFFDRVWLILKSGSSVDPVVYAIQEMISMPDIDEDVPFEFKVVEGILSCLTEDLRTGLSAVKPSVERTLNAIERPKSLSGLDENARKLRLLKQELNLYEVQLHGIRDALFDVLDDDEEMSHMYLSDRLQALARGKKIRRKDAPHEEMEMLLEFYLQDIETLISTEVDMMKQSIDHTEDLININLDTMRNRLSTAPCISTSMSFVFVSLVERWKGG